MASPAKTERGASVCDDFALRERRADGVHAIPLDSPEWAVWLRDPAHASFAFAGRLGSFTARRELRGGHAYWYAYRRRAGALRKVYLGRPEAVTRARLAAAAATLHAPAAIAAKPAGAVTAASIPGTALPAALTSFVGREREMAELTALLATTRLLTLTGAGGVGKTRLALELAGAIRADYPDGVWLVELAALADPALAPQTVVRALGLQEQPGRTPTETLTGWLANKTLLLVLDNCEHLIGACATLAEALLRACPNLRILATSRESLGLIGETTWRVPSLALPDPADQASVEALTRVAAVQLFTDRARAARPGFAVTPENAAAVARVCVRLDGLPLAIELAAARLMVLAAEQIAARLDDRFRLLTDGGRTALPRQQTLRATIDWSHDLLTEPERVALRRLSVFAGGWTLAAAEAVCAGDDIAADGVLDLMARLAAKSLVLVEEAGEATRCRLLETVRQYAAEKLDEAGEVEVARARHADWCQALAERAEPALIGPEQTVWLDRLAAEYDNLRAALAWSLEHDPSAGLGLAANLWAFWRMRGSHIEGRGWLERFLTRAPERTAPRVTALLAAAFLARMQGDPASGRAWAEEALVLGRALGDPALIARVLIELGIGGFSVGDFRSARTWLEEAIPLVRATSDRADLAEGLRRLGQVARAVGDYARARALLEESLALNRAAGHLELVSRSLRELSLVALCQGEAGEARALAEGALAIGEQAQMPASMAIARERLGRVACWEGDLAGAARWFESSLAGARAVDFRESMGWALIGLGQATRRQGDAASAQARLEEALALCRAKADRQGSGAALHELGRVVWQEGDAGSAAVHLTESMALRQELGEPLGIAECLEGLATVAAGTNLPERAARWLGAAEAIREAIGAPLPPVERPDHDETIRQTRAAVGEAAFAAAWAAGRALTAEQAAAEALGDPSLPPAAERAAPVPPAAPGGLSRREVEVLRLVAAGRSNREVAAELSVSVRTVERHITNLYGKIDARNRADATAFAFRHAQA